MIREEAKSCICTIKMLQRLAYNIHGVMDVIDADNCKKIIKALEQEPRWIPVSERLPEDYETVIASVGHEYVYPESRYLKEYGWEWAYESGADYWQDLKEVDAWMPLPEPYKAESEDKE